MKNILSTKNNFCVFDCSLFFLASIVSSEKLHLLKYLMVNLQ